MPTAAEIRKLISEGKVPTGGGRGQVPAGIYDVMVDGAEFSIGENGNYRGKVICRVIKSADISVIGRKFNMYVQTQHEDYLMQSVAEWTEHCGKLGIPEERIYDRAETGLDIIGNIMAEIHRLAIKGVVMITIDHKESGKINPKYNKPYFYNDIQAVVLLGPAPAATPAPRIVPPFMADPATVTAPTSAPVTIPPSTTVTVPTVKAVNTGLKTKAWQR